MKQKRWVLFLAVSLVIGSFSTAGADSILFPVIAVNQPNVTTLISVVNKYGTTSQYCAVGTCPPDPVSLQYYYVYKDTLVGGIPNTSEGCAYYYNITRPTHNGDLVTFDASGTFNGGNAMFNDSDLYGGSFNFPGSGPKRAVLSVTHADSLGNRVDVGEGTLYGEATIMDISGGAAWGYVALNDSNYETLYFDDAGTNSALRAKVVTLVPFLTTIDARPFTFFPTSEWTTRFFVTFVAADSRTSGSSGSVNIASSLGTVMTGPYGGVRDRSGNVVGASVSQSVGCTGAVDLTSLMDTTAQAAVQYTGGWAYFYNDTLAEGGSDFYRQIVVYKLEFVVNNPTYGGTNNNGYCLSCTPH